MDKKQELMIAAEKGDLPKVKFLLKEGISPNIIPIIIRNQFLHELDPRTVTRANIMKKNISI